MRCVWSGICVVLFVWWALSASVSRAETLPDCCSPLSDDCWSDNSCWQTLTDLWDTYVTPEERDDRYFDPYGWQYAQDPFRLGVVKHDELVFLPAAATSGSANGSMQITEFYSWLRLSELVRPNVLLNWTGNADGLYFSGPQAPSIPGQVGRLSLDMEAVFIGPGATNTSIGFHPQLVTDNWEHLTDKALNFDGRIVNTYRYSPEWRLVYGVAFWDRVDVLVIPEVGVVWTPNDRWELRLLFPRSQFSYRIGEVGGGQMWLNSVLEYTVQSYQVGMENPRLIDRMQLQDWRFTTGVRQDFFDSSWTADVGVVFDRNVKFDGPTQNFDVAPTALFRVGLWF